MFIALHKDVTPINQLHACIQAEVLEFIFMHWRKDQWSDKVCMLLMLALLVQNTAL